MKGYATSTGREFRSTTDMGTAVVVNGRYEQLEQGGYRRFAREISRNLDATIVQPPPAWARGVRGRLWEQSILPRASRGRVLFSPANSGPLGHPRHVVVVHDILALQHPEWYNRQAARLQRATLPRLVRGAAAVVAPSRKVADELVVELSVDAERVHVVRPAVGHPFGPDSHPFSETLTANLHRLGLDLDDGRPLAFGLISPNMRKNSDHLLRVFALLQDRRPELTTLVAGIAEPSRVVSGDGRPSRAAVPDLGPLSDEDLAELFRRADVFVSLPRAEGFGMPLLEAAVSGAAVVTTAIPAASEVVSHVLGDRCMIVDAADLHGAIAAIESVLREPRENRDCLHTFAAAHEWRDRAESMAEIIDHVAGA